MNIVSVSTLPMDFSHLDISLHRISTADYLHIDVMDGIFIKQKVLGVDEVKLIDTNLVKNIHLMIADPVKFVEDYIDAGGDIINFHFEAAKYPEKVIEKIRKKGAKVGLSINPDTPVSKIKKLIPLLDQVMVMSVHPGEGGQEFIPETLDKIKEIRKISDEIDIEVDGGINEKTGGQCVDAGANILCSGSYVFSFDNPKLAIDILRNI